MNGRVKHGVLDTVIHIPYHYFLIFLGLHTSLAFEKHNLLDLLMAQIKPHDLARI